MSFGNMKLVEMKINMDFHSNEVLLLVEGLLDFVQKDEHKMEGTQ
jgi:hypothetical protein